MTFRVRLILALVALATVPLLVLGYGVRSEMRARLDADAAGRAEAAAASLRTRFTESLAADRRRMESLAAGLANDNRFRTAIADVASEERRWLLDWASETMRVTGLATLEVQDSTGRILSSGLFRNDFDRVAPAAPRAVASTPARAAVIDARSPDAPVLALVTTATFTVRSMRFTVVGGTPFDSAHVAALSPGATIAAVLVTGATPARDGEIDIASLPYVNEAASGDAATARIVLLPDGGATRALKAGVTRWLLVTVAVTLLIAVAVAVLLGRSIAAPIVELSGRTASLDLDRLDQKFVSGRDDEIGALERTLDALTGRLRTSVSRLREAERAAATGDLARQVNHDIKNGLAPIRNVLRHLAQTAEKEPAALAGVFAERRGTLDASVEYLDALARNYARLSPTLGRGPTDPRPVMHAVAQGVTALTVDVRVSDTVPPVLADAVVLQRVLDNLVSNAVEALEGKPGTVMLAAESVRDGAQPYVRFVVADTGRGMTREELALAFNDFHTTKRSGTGLGLSVVRRLLTDVGGSVRAETAPGHGTTFTVDIPAAVR